MKLSVKFNGHELNEYLEVTKLTRSIGPNRTNTLQKLGLTHGEHYLGYSKGVAIHEMKFAIITDLPEKKRELAGILDVSEPSELIFGDEPDKYMLAIPDSDVDFDDEKFYGNGTINWVVPEGYAHSVSESVYTAIPNEDGILAIQIANAGTETAELSFEATMTSDNGFLGAVGPLGAMEFGNIAEVDGFNDNDEMAFRDWFTPTSESNWTKNNGVIDWKISHGGNPNLQQGAFSWKNEWAEATNFGTTKTDNRWYGPSISRTIPPKKSTGTRDGNWKLRYWVQHKSQGNAKKLGRQELNISASGNSIVTFVIYDDANTSNKTTFEIRLQGIVKKRFYADADLLEFYGSIDIWKEDNTIYFKIYSKDTGKILTYAIYDEEVAAAPVDKITYWCSKYYSNQVCLMSINFMDFWWASKGFVDTANRWTTDDVLKYNGTTGKFYVNDVLSMGDIIQGSTDLKIPPGVWTVEFYYSDFGKTPPNIVGTLRERWL